MLIAFCGCGRRADKWVERRPPTFTASGVVDLNGTPVADAVVAFDSQEHNLTAVGRTNREGRFSLKTYNPGDGAAAGEHRVQIIKLEVTGYDSSGLPLGEVNRLPARYADGSGGLRATVEPKGKNFFRFELTDRQPAAK